MKKPQEHERVLTGQEVFDYLQAHPEFFGEHPQLLEAVKAPKRELGGGVVDFQHFLVKNLQEGTRSLKSKYDGLIDFCRDNMSVQLQVHQAVLKLIRARSLATLLEVITQDLMQLFDVDVVRLAMESSSPEHYETLYGEQNVSGIVFVEPGLIDAALGHARGALLVPECDKKPVPGFEQIFAECVNLVKSCALLRLDLHETQRPVLLAFGVRYPDRFHTGQGLELLSFLAAIVGHQFDRYLQDLDI